VQVKYNYYALWDITSDIHGPSTRVPGNGNQP